MPDTLREIQKSGLPHCSRRFVFYITQSSGVQGDLVWTWFFVSQERLPFFLLDESLTDFDSDDLNARQGPRNLVSGRHLHR